MKRYFFVVVVLAIVGFACAKDLGSLAPFPCAEDGTCPTGFACDGGTCQCPTGLPLCGGTTCIDLQADIDNCGSCGAASPTGYCASGCPVTTSASACVASPACGCGESQTCIFDVPTLAWKCQPAGPSVGGATCTEALDCIAGYVCEGSSGLGTCVAYCSASAPCPLPEVCCALDPEYPDGGGLPGAAGAYGSACLPPGSC